MCRTIECQEKKFNKEFNDMWGDMYVMSYDKYIGRPKTILNLTCKNGHNFTYTAGSSISIDRVEKDLCSKCRKERRVKAYLKKHPRRGHSISKKEAVSNLYEIHGSLDYIFIEESYVDSSSEMEVICRTHGKFTKKYRALYRGVKCPLCPNGGIIKKTKDFKDEVAVIHGDNINLNDFLYHKGGKTSSTVTCVKHSRKYEATPQQIKSKYGGCCECIEESKGSISWEDVLSNLNDNFHNIILNKETYRYKDRVKFECKDHGSKESSVVSLINGGGCADCYLDSVRTPLDKVIFDFEMIHGFGKFDYSEFIYINERTKGKMTCNTCDHSFYRNRKHHMRGSKCPKCSTNGIYPDKEAIIY